MKRTIAKKMQPLLSAFCASFSLPPSSHSLVFWLMGETRRRTSEATEVRRVGICSAVGFLFGDGSPFSNSGDGGAKGLSDRGAFTCQYPCCGREETECTRSANSRARTSCSFTISFNLSSSCCDISSRACLWEAKRSSGSDPFLSSEQ